MTRVSKIGALNTLEVLKSYPHSYDKGGEEWATTEYYEGGENGLFITTKHVKGDGTVKKD